MNNVILFFLILIILSGCLTDKNNQKYSFTTEVLISNSTFNDVNISDYFVIDKVVSLHKAENYLIGEIHGVIFEKDIIYILDGKQGQVLIFNQEGKGIGKIKEHGKGPFEFSQITDIDVSEGNIYISDIDLGKFITFNHNFEPIDEVKSLDDYYSFNIFDKDNLVYYSGNGVKKETKINNEQYNNLVFISGDKIKNSFLPFHESHAGRIYKGGFFKAFASKGNSHYFYNSAQMEIYKVNEEGSISGLLKIIDNGENFDIGTTPYDKYMSMVKTPGKPRLLNTIDIGKEYIYYQISVDNNYYRALYLYDSNTNILFGSKKIDEYLGVHLNVLQYKGDDNGLVCAIYPDQENLRDSINRPKIIQDHLENSQEIGNPILIFLKYKDSLNEE